MTAPAVSRRRFLAAMGIVGGLVAAPQVVRGIPLRAESLADVLRAGRFLPLIGESFEFQPSDGPVIHLVLHAVERIGRGAGSDRSFELRFNGPAPRQQGGQTGELRGGELPPITLFVVPTGLAKANRQEWTASILGGDEYV